jgi:hypothetical protein
MRERLVGPRKHPTALQINGLQAGPKQDEIIARHGRQQAVAQAGLLGEG